VTQQSLFCARLRRDGVDHIDTSEALRPYPLDLVIVNIHQSD
jgi:hypothetical protein